MGNENEPGYMVELISLPRQGPSGTPAKFAEYGRVPGRLFIFHFPLKLM